MDEAVTGHLLPPRLDSPAACRSPWDGSTYNVLEEVHYGVLILGPAVLRLLRQGAVVGSSRCVMSILKERAWGARVRSHPPLWPPWEASLLSWKCTWFL